MTRIASVRRLWMLCAVPIVAALATPTVAFADNNAGTGAAAGTMTFVDGQGQPTQVGGDNFTCHVDSWSLAVTAAFTVVADVPAAQYPGPVAAGATGGSSCAATTHEIGSWTMWMQSTGVLGQFNCGSPSAPALTGIYLRVGTEEVVDILGNCSVANKPQGRVEFVAAGSIVVETTQPSGIKTAAWAGPFVLYPAL